MPQRVIVDVATAAGRSSCTVTVLLRPNDVTHVFTVPPKESGVLESAFVPFLAAARRGTRLGYDSAGPPPGTSVRRLIVDFNGAIGSGITVTVLLKPNGARHVFSVPPQKTRLIQSTLSPFITYARQAASRPADPSLRTEKPKRDRIRPAAIREWARANGHKLPSRGRIPNAVVTAYENALASRQVSAD